MAKDKCVVCGEETPYEFETHVDYRYGYVDGMGQLCKECYDNGTQRNMVLIPEHIIKSNSNDMELGKLVRRYYYEQYS